MFSSIEFQYKSKSDKKKCVNQKSNFWSKSTNYWLILADSSIYVSQFLFHVSCVWRLKSQNIQTQILESWKVGKSSPKLRGNRNRPVGSAWTRKYFFSIFGHFRLISANFYPILPDIWFWRFSCFWPLKHKKNRKNDFSTKIFWFKLSKDPNYIEIGEGEVPKPEIDFSLKIG